MNRNLIKFNCILHKPKENLNKQNNILMILNKNNSIIDSILSI